jgi:hypothetical protein
VDLPASDLPVSALPVLGFRELAAFDSGEGDLGVVGALLFWDAAFGGVSFAEVADVSFFGGALSSAWAAAVHSSAAMVTIQYVARQLMRLF